MEPIRLGGLASGLDTAAIIEAVLTAERTPAIRLENEIVIDEVKLSAFNDLDIAVTDLRSKTQKLDSFLTWQQMNATSSDDTKLTASASFSAAEATYSINVSQTAKSHTISSDAQASTSTALGLTGDFTVGGEVISVAATDTLDDIRQNINEAGINMDDDERVVASIIDTTLVLEREKTGDTDMTISDGTGSILDALGIFQAGGIKNELQTSEDLAATINNVPITSASNTGVTGKIGGVTLNFVEDGQSTLSVKHDTETVKSLITEFIDTYNSTLELIDNQNRVVLNGVGEEINEIGILQGENLLSEIQIKTRSLVTRREDNPGFLDQDFNSLEKIGIWTDGRTNRLKIVDEEKFEQALTSNFEEVEDLFRDSQGGIISQLDDYLVSLNDPIDGSITNRTGSLTTSISDKQSRVDDIDRRIANLETDMFEQFARMENAIAEINAQSAFVLGSIGAG